ncbi:hypothetical protein LTR28_007678 [Elasticomyces elasticus]|nr:hypothetical protein LTR28_007678 [Elasticomyces elasticus]
MRHETFGSDALSVGLVQRRQYQTFDKPPRSSVFPPDIHNSVELLDVEDVGRSRWGQVKALEALERGEGNKGREVVCVVPGEGEEEGEATAVQSAGPHKVVLQDARGTRAYGVEVGAVEGVRVGMNIGSKVLLRMWLIRGARSYCSLGVWWYLAE